MPWELCCFFVSAEGSELVASAAFGNEAEAALFGVKIVAELLQQIQLRRHGGERGLLADAQKRRSRKAERKIAARAVYDADERFRLRFAVNFNDVLGGAAKLHIPVHERRVEASKLTEPCVV